MTTLALLSIHAGARRRGAALPIILLFAALLAGLAASAMRSSLSGVRAASAMAEAARADELGRGAAEALAYHLATHDPAAQRGGRLRLRLPEAEIDIDYRSESARIDANLAPLPLITALLVAGGAEPAEAADATDRVRRFRERAARKAGPGAPGAAGGTPEPVSLVSDGGSPALSGTQAPPAASPPAPSGPGTEPKPLAIRDTAEVTRAWGLPDGLARRVLPSLTVSNGTPQVDPILAGKLVLQALFGSDERVDDYLARRASGFATEDSATELLPIASKAFVGFHDSEAVRADVRVKLPHGFARRYEMVLASARSSGSAASAPASSSVPVVVSWRPRP